MNVPLINNNLKRDCCPLCKSGDIIEVGPLDYRGKTLFSTHDIELDAIPELWKCQQCLSGFVQNTIDADTAKRLYSTGQAGERWTAEAFDQSKTREVIAAMAGLFRNKGSVLDVGCNTGEMLDFALGFGCATSGLEHSEVSRGIIRDKGHKAYKSFDEISSQFDVITAFDLFEHLYDVPSFLNDCHDQLKSGGRLVILTGDIHSVSARIAGTHWWYVQYPEHIVFPSRQHMSSLEKFRLLSIDETYASAGYKTPWILGAAQYVRKFLFNGRYNGLPSLGPDHMLVVLGKVANH